MSYANRARMYSQLVSAGKTVPDCLMSEFGGDKIEDVKTEKVAKKSKKVVE